MSPFRIPQAYNADLVINPPETKLMVGKLLCFDVETDEQDNFVGIALTQDGYYVEYFTELHYEVKTLLEENKLLGHGAKFDIDMLTKWGVNTSISMLVDDTKIMAYVFDSSNPSFGLKDLAKKYLKLEWPTYQEMVHPDPEKPHTKVTLDKRDKEDVAHYCGMDALSTFRLYKYFMQRYSTEQKNYYLTLEMPFYHLLYKMEKKGVQIDVDYLKKLDGELETELIEAEKGLRAIYPGDYDINSPKQMLKVLQDMGHSIESTGKTILDTLLPDPFIEQLLKYRKVHKLQKTYTKGLLKIPTLPRVHTKFNQVNKDDHGIITGRISSSDPNLQNIPKVDKKETNKLGSLIRKLFIAAPGHTLLCADYSQVEYRLLAEMSNDPILVDAFKNGEDVHEAAGKLLNKDRAFGKTFNFASVYGAGDKRIAAMAKITPEEANALLTKYWAGMKKAAVWVTAQKFLAKKNGGVKTILGRFIPILDIRDKNKYKRFAAERRAVNYTIQGSCADILKKAMLDMYRDGIMPILQVHDELIFEVPDGTDKEAFRSKVVSYLQNAIRLKNVELTVEAKYGSNWSECK